MANATQRASVLSMPVIEGLEGRMLLSSAWVGTWNVQLTELEVQNGGEAHTLKIAQSTSTNVATITELGAGSFRLTAADGFTIDLTGNETSLAANLKGRSKGSDGSYDQYFRLQKFDNAYASVFSGRIDYDSTKSQITRADLSAGLATPQGAPVTTVNFPWQGGITFHGLSAEGTFDNSSTAHSSTTTDTMTGSITTADGLTYQVGPVGKAPDTFIPSGNQLVRVYSGFRDNGRIRVKSVSLLMQGPGGRVFNAGAHVSLNIDSGQIGYVSLDSGYTDPYNSAPILATTPRMSLDTINEDARSNAGTLISDLIARDGADNVTVIKVGAKDGIALTGVNTACGRWQYSTDNGATWTNVGVVSDTSALLLGSDSQNRLRLVPARNYAGVIANAITFRAWDQTAKSNGIKADVSANGGTRPYSSVTATARLRVTAFNDAPVLSTVATTVRYVEGAAPVRPFSNVTLTDVDSPNLTGAVIAITGYAGPEDKLLFASTTAITGSIDTVAGTLTLKGTASLAAYQAAIRSVGYRNKSANPNTTARTFSVQVSDLPDRTPDSNELQQVVLVKAVKTAPVVLISAVTLLGAQKNTRFAITFDMLAGAIQAAATQAGLAAGYRDPDTDSSSLGFRITALSGNLTKGASAPGTGPILLMPTETIGWRPATGATGRIAALKVQVWDGTLGSTAFITVIIKVV